jgi:hypothetical protein
MAAIPLTRPLMGGRRSPGDSCPHPTSIAYDGALRIDVRQLSKMSLGIACSPETHAGFSMSRTMLPASTAMIREQNAARKPTGAGAKVIDLGGNPQGSVADSRSLDGPIGSLLRKNVAETDNSIAPRIECWPVQLERNALKNYQNSDDPRVVSGRHYMHRPPQGHPDR